MSDASNKFNIIFKFLLVSTLFVFLISACGFGNGTSGGISTWTPSPSATPTCDPNISLATPSGWDTNSRLIVILFDPLSTGNNFLEYENGVKTNDVNAFMSNLIPKIIRPGDQISVFELGYRKYEDARYLRIFSYIDVPQLYDTPQPEDTLTPITENVDLSLEGLAIKQATVQAAKTQLAHSFTATAVVSENICKVTIWNDSAIYTATAYNQTEIAEVATIKANITSAADTDTNTGGEPAAFETPYSDDVVYEGLYHTTFDLKSDCAFYDQCILLIIDTLDTWTFTNQLCDECDIDLSDLDLVYVLMPNCKDINQPTCKGLQEFWDGEFVKYGAPQAAYQNGVRAEINLLETLRR